VSRRKQIPQCDSARRALLLGAPWLAFAVSLAGPFEASLAQADEMLSDPTRPPVSAPAAPGGPEQDANAPLELRAIFHADDRRFAVINGRRVQTADHVAGAEVVSVEVDRVRLRRDGEIIELELVSSAFKNARKTPASADSRDVRRADTAKPDDPRGAMK
jgi:hypothetical protein